MGVYYSSAIDSLWYFLFFANLTIAQGEFMSYQYQFMGKEWLLSKNERILKENLVLDKYTYPKLILIWLLIYNGVTTQSALTTTQKTVMFLMTSTAFAFNAILSHKISTYSIHFFLFIEFVTFKIYYKPILCIQNHIYYLLNRRY